MWLPEYWRILKNWGASLYVIPSFIEKPEWGVFLAMDKTRALELLLCNSSQSGVGRSCVIRYDSRVVMKNLGSLGGPRFISSTADPLTLLEPKN